MFANHNPCNSNTSTPKRRRLGTGRILRSKSVIENSDSLVNCSPIVTKQPRNVEPSNRCESPHLPCNQVEFLFESVNDSQSSDIPGTPGAVDSSQRQDWESLIVSTSKFDEFCHKNIRDVKVAENFDDISDDMFHSKLEQSTTNYEEKSFKSNIQESFKMINESIFQMNESIKNNTFMFETRDSFLLDVKESCVEKAEKPKRPVASSLINKLSNTFYGLPMATKDLFKTYRNIEKLYDWQEDCLNLPAIKERQNLIYALPTSGGKTLVAEILMLQEILVAKKNALFILPFVAIVQEKIWSLSPFALQLEFLVEEYAGGKGHIPPKKRRNKNSIYVATIEKGLGLVRSLIELNRLHEIGLIVVDELHLIGEKGRGGTLEMLLSTVIFTNRDIQIVGMSATIGNLDEIARFLRADVFQREFRPVELTEYVKLGDMLHKITTGPDGVEVVPHRELAYEYSAAALALDPDKLGGLVSEVVPSGSCLVFCPTKKNCENVAALLCKVQRREMATHRTTDRQSLEQALRAEGVNTDLLRMVRCGVAYHHAGLASDERNLLEQAFRSGVLSVLCCTSTLAAGVNLPAKRVIVRAPLVGREFIPLAAYRQMVGRAGRAGVCQTGESIVICGARDWPRLREVLCGGLSPARSSLRPCVASLLLSAVALGVATRRPSLRQLLQTTLMHVQATEIDETKSVCDESLRCLLQSGVLEVPASQKQPPDASCLAGGVRPDCVVYNDSELTVSRLGRAAIKGCMDLPVAEQLLRDLDTASKSLVVMGSLHLLYLVTPQDGAGVIPDYRHYYSLYGALDEEGVQTARVLGITEMNAVRMMTGKPITSVPEQVLCRFYLALMLHDLWKQVPFPDVAVKYNVPRGKVQAVMTSAASFAACAHRLCDELSLWPFAALFAELATRLQTCAAPDLQQLLQLPAVRKARALQLMRAGYKRVEDVAKASADDLVSAVAHLSRTAANHLISAARMMLIEKVENLRAEAEDVMEELNA